MREIKFRAWMKPDKVMLSHEQLMSIPVTYHDVFEGNSKYPCMQFTGLLDKNGVEIYESDIAICHDKDRGTLRGVVEFNDNDKDIRGLILNSHRSDYWYIYNNDIIEVIGNVYEHGDLLK